MSNTWYYSEGDKSVGPLSLAELTAILSRVSDARDVLVWRNGFSSWLRAEDVPELAANIVKPPALMAELEPDLNLLLLLTCMLMGGGAWALYLSADIAHDHGSSMRTTTVVLSVIAVG